MRVISEGQVRPIDGPKPLDPTPETDVNQGGAGDTAEPPAVRASTRGGQAMLDRLLGAPYTGPSTEALMALTRGNR